MIEGFVPWPQETAETYRRAGLWTGRPLGALVADVAACDPRRAALVAGGVTVSYGELDARIARRAAGMQARGLRPGDHVVVQLPSAVSFVEVVVACFRLGVVPVLALPQHRLAEIGYLARHVAAVAYIAPATAGEHDFRVMAAEVRAGAPAVREVWIDGDPGPWTALADVDADPGPLPDVDASGPAFCLLSGGTTGTPKLIPRTHDDYRFQITATAREMAFGEDGVYLAALPVAHNAALGCPGVLGALNAGACAVLASSPSPDEAFPLIERHGVTLTTLMPAFVAVWVELGPDLEADLSGVTIEVGGAMLDPAVARQVRPVLGATLTHWFGMAEGPLCFTRPADGDEAAAGSQGRPLSTFDELRVVTEDGADVAPGQPGELLYGGPTTLRGYYRSPEHNERVFTRDGLLRTGDLVRLEPDGSLVVTGRIKDVVNRGGEKVAAEELEEHLLAHPALARVAVVAVPDAQLGEKTCAVVVARGAAPALLELKQFLAARGVAEYKFPDRLEVVPDLPLTSIGKVDKKRLRAERAGAPLSST